jgi:DNA-binding NarL/FixJ family response regulator
VTNPGAHLHVLVVDDHLMLRESLTDYLGAQWPEARIEVAASLQEAQDKCVRLPPDLIILDLSLDDAAGLQALSVMRMTCRGCWIVVLSGSVDASMEKLLIERGADAFVPKSGRRDQLLTAIRGLLARRQPSRDPSGQGASGSARRSTLTPQQTVVLDMVVQGLSNKEIAQRTGLSHGTVRNYVSELLLSLGVANRAQLITLFRR